MVDAGSNPSDAMSDRDKAWLVYELHDGLLQWILTAGMNLEQVKSRLEELPQIPSEVRKQLEQSLQFVREAGEEGRMLIRFLDHTQAEEATAVEQHLARFIELRSFDAQAANQTLIVEQGQHGWPQLPPSVAWSVLRVLKQAVVNAITHAGACTIRVRSSLEGDAYRMCVEDDGCGFNVDAARAQQDRFGISSMEQRARLIGGQLQIASSPGAGTRVTLMLPRKPGNGGDAPAE